MMNRFYEELSMNAWPSLSTHHYDGWLLRYANKYTKRANSIYPLYESGLDLVKKIAYCEAYYEQLDMPTTYKMNDSDALKRLDRQLEDMGYHVLNPTDVMILELTENMIECQHTYDVQHGYSKVWADRYADTIFSQADEDRALIARETLNDMLKMIKAQSFYIFLKEDDKVIGIGNGVVEQGYLGIYNVIVNEAYRGLGNGRKIMEALIAEGVKLGAKQGYLQVICDNEIACNLYKSMGYKKIYTYWYRRKDIV